MSLGFRSLVVLLSLFAFASSASAEMITNGGFETGDFTGWTTGANSFPQYIVTNPVHSGTFAAQIAGFSFNPNTLSQTITTTLSGQSYDLSFWRYQQGGGPTVSLDVLWNGNSIFSELNPPFASFNIYQQFMFHVTGTGNDTLTFVSANNPSFTYLDDVSLTQSVPEPTCLTLFGLGSVGLVVYRRMRRKGE